MICRNYPSLKTVVPDVLETILPRRDIIRAIDIASLNELVYITAPYGCGKTLATISWLKEHKWDAAWVSLGKGDDSPEIFWILMASAILRFVGEQDIAENVLQGTYPVENALTFLSETLVRVSPDLTHRLLIIDNCAYLQNPEILRDLKNIICDMLGCWKIVFIGRGELPPVFNDLILKKSLRQIIVDELSFKREETAEYFQMNGFYVDNSDLFRIQEETDGWPAALNAILTAPRNGTLNYSFAARSYVTGYFEREIWEPLDEETKYFLMKTAILDKITPSICHSITEIKETLPIINRLYANGIFLTKLEEFNSFSYHRVFKEFLLYKLSQAPDIDINSLYVKLGWWLYERDDSVAALLCFYKVGNICGINQAFKKVKPADIGMDKYVEVTSCLLSLDVNDLKDYPEVAARIALLFFITNNIEEMKRIYSIILKWLEPGALKINPESYIDFNWEIGWLRYVNPDEDILFNPDFEKWLNVGDYAPHLRDSDRSRASALRLPSALRCIRDYSLDVDRALVYYETRIRTENGFVGEKADLYLTDFVIAEIAYEQENFDKASQIIKNIMPLIEIEKFTELYFMGTVLLVKMMRVVNDSKEIEALTNRLGSLIEKNGHLYLLPNFHAFELRNYLAIGKSGVTDTFFKENEPYASKSHYYLIYRHITFVRALLSERKYNESILILGNLELLCRRYNRNMDLIEINILLAITEYGLGHEANANEHIKAALDRGRTCGFIRIFSDDAISLWPILNLIHKSDIDEYIERVIISCKKMLPHKAVDKKLSDLLTGAEVEVFKLLKMGLSVKEIASTRNVKTTTINTQISSLYEKLGVKNRVSAVALAFDVE